MTTQKRKSPDRRKADGNGKGTGRGTGKGGAKASARRPALFIQAIYAVGSFAARYPRVIGGSACFAIIFGFVSANALWYQPGGHPSPFLRTRDIDDRNGIPGYKLARPQPPADVTTFRIERADDSKLITATPAAPNGAHAPAADPLVADIQRELARRGLYEGTADGVNGTRTEAAILFFEQTVGLPQSGAATPQLLAALRAEPQPDEVARQIGSQGGTSTPSSAPLAGQPANPSATSAAQPHGTAAPQLASRPVPMPRPTENLKGEDPVAAAIRASERRPSPPAAIPVKAPAKPAEIQNAVHRPAGDGRADNPAASASGLPSPDMVQQIQRGLSNIAYTDVTVDGVAGTQTKAAILHFQRHYRLPETGEPDERVLKKLQSIGAL